MNILVVGSGGREHALVWKIKQSPHVDKIYCAPGNGGISTLVECVDIKADDIAGLAGFVSKNNIDFTVVGPEVPLVAGVVDEFDKRGLKIFGPSQKAAQLEGSKVFAKEFMNRHNVPTAAFKSFDNFDAAAEYIKECSYPLVVKADGLAAGKGVIICISLEEAMLALEKIMKERTFKSAGDRVIVEECLIGEEASILAISDGNNFVVLESSQDHKRIFDGDIGPNTGGMGAYSPAPVVTKGIHKKIVNKIVKPVIEGMRKEGNVFKGVLYVGVMVTEKGPHVLEFNVRFGDPETQAILPRLKTDIVEIMLASCEGNLDKVTTLQWDNRACVCVVMSSKGYPGSYEKGKEISGLESISDDARAIVFHAGTRKQDGKIITSGGRVLGVTGLGDGIEQAIQTTYSSLKNIKFEGCHFRHDIGQKALGKG